jgi:hypothetical protein
MKGRDARFKGPPKYLNEQEERTLCDWIHSTATTSRPTKAAIAQKAEEILYQNCRQHPQLLRGSWTNSFLKRHQDEFTTTSTECIESNRLINFEDCEEWFTEHEAVVSSVRPELFANMDETMVAPGKRKFVVVVPRDNKEAVEKIKLNDEHITLFVKIWANYTMSKPGLVLPLKNVPAVESDLYNKYFWAGHATGWITTPIFHEYLSSFIKEVQSRREEFHIPITEHAVLLIDDHSTHNTEAFTLELQKHNIKIITLPPHSTHILQPLDHQFFKVLKAHLANEWKKNIESFEFLTRPLRRSLILKMCSRSLYHAQAEEVLEISFQATGMYPFTRQVLERQPSLLRPHLTFTHDTPFVRLQMENKLLAIKSMEHLRTLKLEHKQDCIERKKNTNKQIDRKRKRKTISQDKQKERKQEENKKNDKEEERNTPCLGYQVEGKYIWDKFEL